MIYHSTIKSVCIVGIIRRIGNFLSEKIIDNSYLLNICHIGSNVVCNNI